ncbi:polycystic kidney disease protein 1-like 2 isoform X2 [Schistocerca serialis cubense]|nr:polycystic kidney disease protein 1-like 2 isoform X2 [Schistocerca serialis cubense]XP_049938658.1 polycystic kidney disease protein 1-like 2 isoform X2 [Schistocerca serialis cubense]
MSSVIAGTAMFLLIMYGFSYGRMKSYLWLTSMLMSVAIDALVNEPVKIMCIDVLVSSLLKRQPSIMEIQAEVIIEPHELQLQRDQKTRQENHLDVLRKRMLSGPLNRKKLKKLQQRECKYLYCSFLIENLIVSATYLVILIFSFLYMEDQLIYFSTRCFEDLFISGVHASMNYSNIRLETDSICKNSVFRLRVAYQNHPTVVSSLVEDTDRRGVGSPHRSPSRKMVFLTEAASIRSRSSSIGIMRLSAPRKMATVHGSLHG